MKQGDFALRKVGDVDGAQLLVWRNSDRVRANMYSDHLIAEDEHATWLKRVLQDETVDYLVCEHLGRPIGLVAFTDVDRRSSRASWAFYLGEEDVPPGSGAAMEFLALEHAFKVIGIRKLCCEVLAFNTRVLKLHKRFGFRQEGLLAQHVLKNGRFEDVVLLALFAADWPAQREAMAIKLWSDA